MATFLWHLLLATVWALARGEVSVTNVATGFVLGYAVLWLGRDLIGSSGYCRRLPRIVELILYFLWKLLLANLRVALDVMTPRHRMRPGIISVPLDAESDEEILLLAGMITLTPGTLSLGLSADRRSLYVHAMYVDDVETEKQKLKDGFERRLLEVLR